VRVWRDRPGAHPCAHSLPRAIHGRCPDTPARPRRRRADVPPLVGAGLAGDPTRGRVESSPHTASHRVASRHAIPYRGRRQDRLLQKTKPQHRYADGRRPAGGMGQVAHGCAAAASAHRDVRPSGAPSPGRAAAPSGASHIRRTCSCARAVHHLPGRAAAPSEADNADAVVASHHRPCCWARARPRCRWAWRPHIAALLEFPHLPRNPRLP